MASKGLKKRIIFQQFFNTTDFPGYAKTRWYGIQEIKIQPGTNSVTTQQTKIMFCSPSRTSQTIVTQLPRICLCLSAYLTNVVHIFTKLYASLQVGFGP